MTYLTSKHLAGRALNSVTLSRITTNGCLNMKTGFFKKAYIFTLVIASSATSTLYAEVPELTVVSNQILSGDDVKCFAGNSFLPVNTGVGEVKMYNSSVIKWLKEDWKSKIVRVVLDADTVSSYSTNHEENIASIETVVDAAISNDMYVIIDLKFNHAENNKTEVISFYEQMAQKYGSHNNVLYEISIEPLQISWDEVIKPYAEDIISVIRSIDPDNLIVVGTPNRAQDVDIASQNPIMGNNIAYALQFSAGTHRQSLRNKALTAINNGLPLIVTQWSTVNTDGSGEVAEASSNEWMDFLKEHNITHLNWSVSDKEESSSIITPGVNPEGNWAISDLTTSGTYVRNIINKWNSSSESSVASLNSAQPYDTYINIINFDDFIEVIVNVDVDTDTDVNVDVDVDNMIKTDLIKALFDKIIPEDQVNTVDKVLNSNLDNSIEQIMNSDQVSITNQIFSSDLYAAINNNSSNNTIDNKSLENLLNETALTELIDQLQLEGQGNLLYKVIDLIKMIDLIQSGNQSGIINKIKQGQSEITIASLNDVIDLIATYSELEIINQLEPDNLQALISLIALLIKNDTTS
jgi:hypothetical protein